MQVVAQVSNGVVQVKQPGSGAKNQPVILGRNRRQVDLDCELVGQRQRLLETFFSAVGNRDNKEELIHAVATADRLLGDLASAARQDTLTELDGHLHRRKALGVYEAASRSVKSD